MLHIRTNAVPAESANTMTIVERNHTTIHKAHNIIQREDISVSKVETLQMAVKAVNNFVGPNGLLPTLLVFKAFPRIDLLIDAPTPLKFQRTVALRKETAVI